MIKSFFLLSLGLFGGLWLAWPGIVAKQNWHCVIEVLDKSKQDKTDLRAIMAVSPKFLLERENPSPLTKLRILGDACFR